MSLYFLDSSALVKRYVEEPGSSWVRYLAAPPGRNRLIIARATYVEVLSALARRQREGSLATDVKQTVAAFRYDLDVEYQVTELDRSLAELAGDLVTRHPLRAYDAMQLASALRLQASLLPTGAPGLTFISADERLLSVAVVEGLPVDNPIRHP